MIHILRIRENEKETVSFYANARGLIDVCFISSHWMLYALYFKNSNSREPLVGYVIEKHNVNSISNYLYFIRSWFTFFGVIWFGNEDIWIKYVQVRGKNIHIFRWPRLLKLYSFWIFCWFIWSLRHTNKVTKRMNVMTCD